MRCMNAPYNDVLETLAMVRNIPIAQLKPLAATGVVAKHARLMTCTYGIAELTGSLCKLAFHFMRAPQ